MGNRKSLIFIGALLVVLGASIGLTTDRFSTMWYQEIFFGFTIMNLAFIFMIVGGILIAVGAWK